MEELNIIDIGATLNHDYATTYFVKIFHFFSILTHFITT
jgi:hypothetical protein